MRTSTSCSFLATLASLALGAVPAHAGDPTLPEKDEHAGPSRAQLVDAFAKDCHATFQVTALDDGEPAQKPECEARDTWQNCNPDTFGCEGDLEVCQDACNPVCNTCAATCGDTCDGCKSRCKAGDLGCAKTCATQRADCRDRCITAHATCATKACPAKLGACDTERAARASHECNDKQCDAYAACFNGDGASEAGCAPKAPLLSGFCRRVCQYEGANALREYEAMNATKLKPDADTAARCTAEAQCPKDYAAVAPYLARFCAGTLSSSDMGGLRDDAGHGVSKRSLGLLFNAFGAFYGYEFKSEKWMNAFFYGGGAWLPAACQPMMKKYAKVGDVPGPLQHLRDRLKAVWLETE